jgi:selenocysteine lyase/cysteine desulfurase
MGIAGPRLAGVIRIGLSLYSTAEEADRLIAAIRERVLEERANG